MKPLTKNLIRTAIACPVIGLLIGAATQQSIRWITDIRWDVQPDGSYTQPGKRSDGLLVWREIHPATTNSPSEDATISIEHGGTNSWPILPGWWTNIVVTNIPMTNIKAFIDTNYLRLDEKVDASIPMDRSWFNIQATDWDFWIRHPDDYFTDPFGNGTNMITYRQLSSRHPNFAPPKP